MKKGRNVHLLRRTCAADCCLLPKAGRVRDPAAAKLARTCRALGHPARFQIVWLLGHCGTLCVRAFPASLDLGQPTVSHHLKVLRDAGVVDVRRRGRRRYYAVRRGAVKTLLEALV